MMKLPFFGYNIFFVEKVSDSSIPVPCYFGVNKEQIIVVDSITQVCHTIPPLCPNPSVLSGISLDF